MIHIVRFIYTISEKMHVSKGGTIFDKLCGESIGKAASCVFNWMLAVVITLLLLVIMKMAGKLLFDKFKANFVDIPKGAKSANVAGASGRDRSRFHQVRSHSGSDPRSLAEISGMERYSAPELPMSAYWPVDDALAEEQVRSAHGPVDRSFYGEEGAGVDYVSEDIMDKVVETTMRERPQEEEDPETSAYREYALETANTPAAVAPDFNSAEEEMLS